MVIEKTQLIHAMYDAAYDYNNYDHQNSRFHLKLPTDFTQSVLTILKELHAQVHSYGGRYIQSANPKLTGSITFHELYKCVYLHNLHDQRILARLEALEKSTKTDLFQDIGSFFQRIPYKINLLFRRIFCCFMPVMSKSEMKAQLQLQLTKEQLAKVESQNDALVQ